MSTDGHTIPNYMAIFWWLLGLTIVEIAWAILPHGSKLALAGGIVGFAIIKAVLVALYFMHLKFERKTLGILFASTLILGMILVSVGIGELVLPRP
jgi:cytochrome c oxidase subunit 4